VYCVAVVIRSMGSCQLSLSAGQGKKRHGNTTSGKKKPEGARRGCTTGTGSTAAGPTAVAASAALGREAGRLEAIKPIPLAAYSTYRVSGGGRPCRFVFPGCCMYSTASMYFYRILRLRSPDNNIGKRQNSISLSN
jgi:hypothetical protein